jgi:hypothetical protein
LLSQIQLVPLQPGVSGGKKQKLRMKNFDDFAAHKTRKREHKVGRCKLNSVDP